MAKYEPGEIAKYYFVIYTDEKDEKTVQAWSDNKGLVDMYMEFHKCKYFKVKVVSNYIEEIVKLLEENLHDEIKPYRINTRDPKRKGEVIGMTIPATETEVTYINEETNTFMSSLIGYADLNELIPYLKKKDREAIRNILLEDITAKVCHERRSKIVETVHLDQLMVLYKLFPRKFGI